MLDKKIIIDVRERDEYKQKHIPNSVNIPLTELSLLGGYKTLLEKHDVVLICRSGKRADLAKDHFLPLCETCSTYPGGILAWEKEGHKVTVNNTFGVSIFRQVQIVIGFLVFIFTLLGYFISTSFVLVAGVIGFALFVAGVFGFCMLATLLSKMPWNRIQQ